MSNDAALEKWIEDDMRDVPCVMPVDEVGEYMCRAAWRAAVKHTLAFVAGELNTRAEKQRSRGTVLVRQYLRKLAGIVLQMKP